MPSANYTLSVQAGGVSIQKSRTVTSDGSIGREITIAAAKALSSWVKTDGDTAAGNLAGGHGLSTGTFDVYWSTGARYDVPVTITTNACALDGGTGDNFPASADTTVVLAPQTAVNVSIDGDALKMLALQLDYAADAGSTLRGRVLFEDADGDDIASVTLTADKARNWDIEAGQTNTFTGDPIVSAKVSQESTSLTGVLKIAGIVDSTP